MAKIILMMVCHVIYIPIFYQNYLYFSNSNNESSRWFKINGIIGYANIPLLTVSALFLGLAMYILIAQRHRWYFTVWLMMAIVSLGYTALYLMRLIADYEFFLENEIELKRDQGIMVLMVLTMVVQVVFVRLLLFRKKDS